jgi:hypothetical protein
VQAITTREACSYRNWCKQEVSFCVCWTRDTPWCACRLPAFACPFLAALVFANIGFFDVGLAVFTGRIEWLAGQIVPCGPRQASRSKEQWVSLLQSRLQPVVRKAKAC